MARFDLYPAGDEPGYLLDCQADTLNHLNSRFVVPVRPPDRAPIAAARLNPTFEVDGRPHVMVTHFAAAVPLRGLGQPVGSLRDEHDRIMAALDMLLTGY